MVALVKIAIKILNVDRLMEELKPLGVGGASFVGFTGERNAAGIILETPFATRSEYGHTTRNGIRTPKMADPGELHFEADSDPGIVLDNVLSAHDETKLSIRQQIDADRNADKILVQGDLDAGRDLSQDTLKALARIMLHYKPGRP